MDDPLLYHKPAAEDEAMRRRTGAQRAMVVGIILFGIGATLVLCPFIWGRSGLNKYLIAFGFVAATWGLGCIANGAWDWWRGRR